MKKIKNQVKGTGFNFGGFPKEHKRRMALFYCNGLSRKGGLLYLNIKED